jgi:uncharacterized membrane protein YciS (DUF1049 family)
MSLVKILAILIVAIALGILVVSNFSVVISVVLFSQQTVAVPIGVWLLLAIAVGFLVGSLLQGLLYFQRRPLVKRLRQLQQRLNNEEDAFTYTPPRKPVSKTTNTVIEEDDDWETESIPQETVEWEEREQPPRQSAVPSSVSIDDNPPPRARFRDREEDDRAEILDSREEVYDADFKLIQPPYKQPLAEEIDYPEPEPEEEEEYSEPEEDDRVEEPRDTRDRVASTGTNRDDDNEDWGFDFDRDEEFEQRNRRK